MEVINLTPLEEIKTTLPGIELLMNDKKRNGFQAQASSVKDLGDLNALDRQMDELTGSFGGASSSSVGGYSSGSGGPTP
jgi:hypothetical protein